MNERGASSILSSKVKLGADASAAAGPVGRTASAESDVALRAEILSYFSGARAVRGNFARGLDRASGQRGERADLRKKDSRKGHCPPRRGARPAVAKLLVSTLNQHSRRTSRSNLS